MNGHSGTSPATIGRRRPLLLGLAALLLAATVSTPASSDAVLGDLLPSGVVGVRFEAGPTAARPGEIIASQPFANSAAQPVRVVFVDVLGLPVDVGGTVEVTLRDPLEKATLQGTTTRQTTNGVAVFDDLRIDQVGPNYRLHAVGHALGVLSFSTDSDQFAIVEHGQNCTVGESCVVSATGPNGLASATLTIATPAPSTSAMLTFLSAADHPMQCAGHTPVDRDHVLFFDYVRDDGTPFAPGEGEMAVTYKLDFRKMKELGLNNLGVANIQLCFRSDADFVDRDGQMVPAGQDGLLADCAQGVAAPCISERHATGGRPADRVLKVRVPWMDPQMH